MSRPALEVADIFRDHRPAWRSANAGHVSLDQLKVMSAIEDCRTAALGGHVLRCENAAREQPGLNKKRISPHVLRHTCAMIILQATQDIRKVSLWLGHATLTTTEVYTRGDPTEKLDALASIVPPHLRRGAFQPSDKLIALLKRAS